MQCVCVYIYIIHIVHIIHITYIYIYIYVIFGCVPCLEPPYRSQWNGEITGEYEYEPKEAGRTHIDQQRHALLGCPVLDHGGMSKDRDLSLMSTRIGWPWVCIIWGFKRLTFRIHQPGFIHLGFWMWKLPSSLPDSCSPTPWPGTRWFEELLGALSPRGNIQRVFLLFGSIFAACPTVVFPCFGYQGGFPCNSFKSNRWTRWWFWCRCLGPRGSKTFFGGQVQGSSNGGWAPNVYITLHNHFDGGNLWWTMGFWGYPSLRQRDMMWYG